MAARSERVLVQHIFTNFFQASEAYKSGGIEGSGVQGRAVEAVTVPGCFNVGPGFVVPC